MATGSGGKAERAYWLLKTEPGSYSYDDLVREGKTLWDGVTNNLALKHIRQIKKGDGLIIYHTGDEKAVVGLAEATADPQPDPKADDPKLAVVELKPKKRAKRSVTLAEIKQLPEFKESPLVRMGRLSVVPLSPPEWQKLEQLAGF
jgi:predicted RNA-binding protein with PUA-like domain